MSIRSSKSSRNSSGSRGSRCRISSSDTLNALPVLAVAPR
jgi:hypothetical protein